MYGSNKIGPLLSIEWGEKMIHRVFRANLCVTDGLFCVSDSVFQEQCKGIIVRIGKAVKTILRPALLTFFSITQFDLLPSLSRIVGITDLDAHRPINHRGMRVAYLERDVLHCT
jgi:hypothetical protein